MPRSTGRPSDTRERILRSATAHFARYGLSGARTQSIADEAGVNKAMLYYHFRDKEHLYEETLVGHLGAIVGRVFPMMLRQDLEGRERMIRVVGAYHEFLSAHPRARDLLLQELATGGKHLPYIFGRLRSTLPGLDPGRVFLEFGQMMEQGELRRGDPRQAFLSLISLAVFPYVARPLLQMLWNVDEDEFYRLMGERREAVSDLLDHGLLSGSPAAEEMN
jgi:AcrR family transcriptional regulator